MIASCCYYSTSACSILHEKNMTYNYYILYNNYDILMLKLDVKYLHVMLILLLKSKI